MLMLTTSKKEIADDAARAVQRVSSLDIQPRTPETLTTLLGLPELRVVGFAIETDADTEYVHLFCEHCHSVALCPCCGQVLSGGYDSKSRSVRHLDIWGRRTLIHFPQRRFTCPACMRPFTAQLSWLAPKQRHTQAFAAHIYACITQQKMSRRQVARQEGLHEATVLAIFKQAAQAALRSTGQQPVRVLGIDEIHLGHQEYVLVLSDIARRRVIAVLPDRLKATLEHWLAGLSATERHAIREVSIDMWRPYRQAVRHQLPHARITADRFHVMKQLNHQLDLFRRHLRRQDEPLAELLKQKRWVLLKNRAALTAAEEAQLQQLLTTSDTLRRVYLLKEEFRTICEKLHDRERAARFLRAWLWRAEATGNRYLQRFAQTLRNWWSEFLNYFATGVTQGFVEGINRAIRGIINRAFGFHKFEHFRLHVLAECGPP